MNSKQWNFEKTYNDACRSARRHSRDGDSEIFDAIRKHIVELQKIAKKQKLEIPE